MNTTRIVSTQTAAELNPPQSADNPPSKASAFDKKNNKEKMKPASCSGGWIDGNNGALM